MTRFAAINLADLRAPDAIALPDYAALVAARKADIVARVALVDAQLAADLEATLAIEGELISKLTEADTYREILVRARINDAARAVLLPSASGNDLDQLAARFGIARRLVTPATEETPAVYETDTELRRRAQLAPEAFTTTGSEGAYIHHALMAAPSLIDARPIAYTTSSGNAAIRVVCLARDGNGVPTTEALAAVRDRLNDKTIRPMTVPVAVTAAQPVNYTVTATLQMPPGPDPAVVRASAISAVQRVIAGRRGLGAVIQRQAFEAALRVAGVERVLLTSPAADVPLAPDQVGHCTAVNVAVEVLND